MNTNGPYKIKSSKLVYKNPWISVQEDQVIRPDGKDGIFGVVKMLEGVTVIPLDKDNNVYLAQEFKYAVGRTTIEAISGGIDEGETKEDAVKRELLEETGLKSDDWQYLGVVDPFTTVIKSPNHMYLAQNAELAADSEEKQTLKVIKVPFIKAFDMVQNGEITHGASCIAILKVARLLNI